MTNLDNEKVAAPESIAAAERPWDRFRLATQTGERTAEGHHLERSPYQPDSEKPKKRSRGFRIGRLSLSWGELALVVVALLGLAATAIVAAQASGLAKTGIFALVALAPLLLVVLVLLRADRFAPLKPRFHIFAFLWGAGVATAIAAAVNSGLFMDFIHYSGSVERSETLASVLVAPFSEETMKGAGVILVLLFARHQVVSRKNGAVTGALVGAGFAFTENIFYFLEASAEGSTILGFTIFARALLSPFVHPMATSFIGFALAAALLNSRNLWGWMWRLPLGFAVAFILHAMWNGFASLGHVWLLLYLLVELPLFIAWLVWILRGHTRRLTRIHQGMQPYVVTGWLSVEEQRMVSDQAARRYATKWARKTGRPARKAVSAYMRSAGRLGMLQVRMENSGPTPEMQRVASSYMDAMVDSRELYLAAGAAKAGGSMPRT